LPNNVDQPFLEEIGGLPRLERLELEWPMVASDLSPLLRLDRLTFLSIDSPRSLADFSPLLRLPSLRTLIITNPKNMTDLEWLSDAHHLEVIGIEGGTWSPYKIPTLQPLAGLQTRPHQDREHCSLPGRRYRRRALRSPRALTSSLNPAGVCAPSDIAF
jgi:hypothetical protein